MDAFDQALHDATASNILSGTCVIAADKYGMLSNTIHSMKLAKYTAREHPTHRIIRHIHQ